MNDQDLEKYKKTDGSIDWAEYAVDQLSMITNQPNDHLSMTSNKKIVPLQDLPVFKLADQVSDYVWDIVAKWDWFAKKTVGDQLVRAADSIGANIAEGYGRYFFREYILFLYYSRGSAYETWYWAEKARKRKLITQAEYEKIKEKTDRLPIEINKVVKVVKGESKKWKFK